MSAQNNQAIAANENDFAARLAGMLPESPKPVAYTSQGARLIDRSTYQPHLFPLETVAA